ncbi:hypothetical protein SPRA44_330090 [Serratia proteamaculans]|nr:hypothetical protein SPRA44_330090 [Serratia proteamaculans]
MGSKMTQAKRGQVNATSYLIVTFLIMQNFDEDMAQEIN